MPEISEKDLEILYSRAVLADLVRSITPQKLKDLRGKAILAGPLKIESFMVEHKVLTIINELVPDKNLQEQLKKAVKGAVQELAHESWRVWHGWPDSMRGL